MLFLAALYFFLMKKEFRLALVKTIKPQLIKGVTKHEKIY